MGMPPGSNKDCYSLFKWRHHGFGNSYLLYLAYYLYLLRVNQWLIDKIREGHLNIWSQLIRYLIRY